MSKQPGAMPESARAAPAGSDLERSLGTDFFGIDDLLTDAERELRDGVPSRRSTPTRAAGPSSHC